MANLTIIELTNYIDQFSLEQPTNVLSEAYKIAIGLQHNYKASSDEAKLLIKFQNTLIKKIKSMRTSISIEEHDAITLAKQNK